MLPMRQGLRRAVLFGGDEWGKQVIAVSRHKNTVFLPTVDPGCKFIPQLQNLKQKIRSVSPRADPGC